MKLFLTSEATINKRVDGIKVSCKINSANNFIDNLLSFTKNAKNFVFLVNNPDEVEDNDISAKFTFDALKNIGINLISCIVLDNRTSKNCEEIIKNADIVFLQGGKIQCQVDFIKQNKIDKYLKISNAVLIGKSAGAMILCKDIYNYPEEVDEFDNQRFLSGLNFTDCPPIIPHFEETTGNVYCNPTLDVLNCFYLPDSEKMSFLALPNGSYVFVNDDKKIIYGEAFVIRNKSVKKICENNKTTIIK